MKALIMGKNGNEMTKLNRRRAIHEKCLNCAGWILKEVAECNFNKCSLHPYRTGKGTQNAAKRQKAIREYCLWCMNDQVGEVSKCTSSYCPLFLYRKNRIDQNLSPFEKVDRRDAPDQQNQSIGA